jgi:hypothetical protein
VGTGEVMDDNDSRIYDLERLVHALEGVFVEHFSINGKRLMTRDPPRDLITSMSEIRRGSGVSKADYMRTIYRTIYNRFSGLAGCSSSLD